MEIFKIVVPVIISGLVAIAVILIIKRAEESKNRNKAPEFRDERRPDLSGKTNKDEDCNSDDKDSNYMAEGLVVGLLIGAGLGVIWGGMIISLGASVGMLLGLLVGYFVKN